jgi:uncharacterized protein YjdB
VKNNHFLCTIFQNLFNQTFLTSYPNDFKWLVLPANAANKNVTWTSDNESVATVSNGTVTAMAAGTATITATTADGNKTAACQVTVTVPVARVSLNKTSAVLSVGETVSLTADVLPPDATVKTISGWESSDAKVAIVTAGGVVTAVAAGTTTITVTTASGNKTAVCPVKVAVPIEGASLIKISATLLYINLYFAQYGFVHRQIASEYGQCEYHYSGNVNTITVVMQIPL